ncbi:hypothetical protein E5678_08535 [Hydrogenophaga sp. PAMC20947]|nr:hypothetical protein E5678_08535 [Hydrogenophaga sp. PAMC20947]
MSRQLVLFVIASLALLGPLPAQALGRLTDVEVIDRDSGEVLPVIRHKGDYWIAGRPGARYAVSLQNRQHARVLSVVSVDGVNVISGATAALHQTGYVLAPRQAYRITGWRKSDQEVASFHFTVAPASYAERTGRPDHLGVIGVALFREKEVPPPMSVTPTFPSWRQTPQFRGNGHANAERAAEAEPASPKRQRSEAPESLAKTGNSENADQAADRQSAPMPALRLGTGHGEREHDSVSHTAFERHSDRPDEIVRIRYDSHDNLVAMGIIPAMPIPTRSQPFPDSSPQRYVPDPS